MILLDYGDRLELQDFAGNINFTISSKIEIVVPRRSNTFLSDNGSVIAAQVGSGTQIWFVESGREMLLPETDSQLFLPSISTSGDSKLMVCCLDRGLVWDHVHRVVLLNLEHNQEAIVLDRKYDDLMGPVKWLKFAQDNKTLFSDKWNLDLINGDWNSDQLRRADRVWVSSFYISFDRAWIRFNRENILWLPESHRAVHNLAEYVGKNAVAYNCTNGSVVAMKFAGQFDPSIC
jgi:hypothetical protein